MREELLHIHCSLTHASATQMLYLTSARTGRTLKLRPAMMRLLRTVQSFGDLCEYCAQAKA
jgi:hypothetical protein